MSLLIIDRLRTLKAKCTFAEETAANLGLSPRELAGIIALGTSKRLSCNELAEQMGLSPSRGSRVINSLIAGKYLRRKENERDRRCIFISLTPRGEEYLKKIEDAERVCEELLHSRLNEQELKKVEEGLELLLAAL